MAQITFASPIPLPNGKKIYFDVIQNKFQKLIWLLKFDTNQTEAVIFFLKEKKKEKADPTIGAHHTPKVGCFFQKFYNPAFLLLYHSACLKATGIVFI